MLKEVVEHAHKTDNKSKKPTEDPTTPQEDYAAVPVAIRPFSAVDNVYENEPVSPEVTVDKKIFSAEPFLPV